MVLKVAFIVITILPQHVMELHFCIVHPFSRRRVLNFCCSETSRSHPDMMCLITLTERRGGNCICERAPGRVRVPAAAFSRVPLVWRNETQRRVLEKGIASVVAAPPGARSVLHRRLNSFRFISPIKPTHSKNSTLKCINL